VCNVNATKSRLYLKDPDCACLLAVQLTTHKWPVFQLEGCAVRVWCQLKLVDGVNRRNYRSRQKKERKRRITHHSTLLTNHLGKSSMFGMVWCGLMRKKLGKWTESGNTLVGSRAEKVERVRKKGFVIGMKVECSACVRVREGIGRWDVMGMAAWDAIEISGTYFARSVDNPGTLHSDGAWYSVVNVCVRAFFLLLEAAAPPLI
jgi:hypothetical protein